MMVERIRIQIAALQRGIGVCNLDVDTSVWWQACKILSVISVPTFLLLSIHLIVERTLLHRLTLPMTPRLGAGDAALSRSRPTFYSTGTTT